MNIWRHAAREHDLYRLNEKTPADCLYFKAADGRKLCKDPGNDILQRDKRVRPVAGVQRIIRIVSRYKEAALRDGAAAYMIRNCFQNVVDKIGG